MRNLVAVGLAAVALAAGTPAFAADMQLKAAPMAPPVDPWTGFYIGATGGGMWGRADVTHGPNDPFILPGVASTLTNPINFSGAVFGIEDGYNWRFGQIVLGYEGDLSLASGMSGFANLLPPLAVLNTRTVGLQLPSTYRGRLGWLATPDLLIYGTGGLAIADETFSWLDAATHLTQSNTQWVWGYSAGGGLEWRLGSTYSVKAEYLHLGFDTKTFNNVNLVGGPGFFTTDNHVKTSADIVRVGFNMKWDPLSIFYR
jgi:outer membrane immunogenic protein